MARPGLDKNIKFRRLVRLLGEPRSHVRGYLECLWDVAYENGNPVIGDADAIAIACDYPGEPKKIADALLNCGGPGRAGMIDPIKENESQFQVHDLFDHAPRYVKLRAVREKERLSAQCAHKPKRSARAGAQKRSARVTPAPAPAPAPGIEKGTTSPSTPSPADKPPVEEPVKVRPRDELFDAIVEVTGADPKVNVARIGKVKRTLLAFDPPMTPSEVRTFPAVLAAQGWTVAASLEVLASKASWIRTPPARTSRAPPNGTEAPPPVRSVTREHLEDIGFFDPVTDEADHAAGR